MEFEIKEDNVCYRFYSGDQLLITLWKYDVPNDFNPDRTTRLVEKMEEMFEFMKDNCGTTPDYYCKKWIDSGLIHNIINYVDHGDKEEMMSVWIQKKYDDPLGLSEVKIPKSQAIEAGIIKE